MYTSSRLSPSTELTKCSVASVLIGVLLDNLGLNLPHGLLPTVETALQRQERVDKPLSNSTRGGLQSVSFGSGSESRKQGSLSRYCQGIICGFVFLLPKVPPHTRAWSWHEEKIFELNGRPNASFCWSSKFDTLIDRRTNPS